MPKSQFSTSATMDPFDICKKTKNPKDKRHVATISLHDLQLPLTSHMG